MLAREEREGVLAAFSLFFPLCDKGFENGK
jgi:hypothetical protein